MIVIYFSLDTFEKETTPPHDIVKLKTLYRIAALQNTPPCVIIQTKQKDEIHMIKLLGPSFKLSETHSKSFRIEAKIRVEEWMSDAMAKLEERFSSEGSKVVAGTYFHHRDIADTPGVEAI